MKKLKHLLEIIGLNILFTGLRHMPLDLASFTGGFIARAVGPFLSAHKTARKNIAMVFPDMNARDRRDLLLSMWDNLGRVAGELPHLPGKKLYNRMTIEGLENLPADKKPIIFFSGHLGNWELTYPIAYQRGVPITLVFRQANNAYVDKMISEIRATQSLDMLPKGPKGALRLVRSIKNGNSLAMLIDQKMNEGIAVPFFGRPAMTAPAIAEFALRYNMPILPARVVRTKGCHFKATIYPPLVFEKTGDNAADILTIMTKINQTLESWIRQYPAQWFWVHKRWPQS